MADKTYCGNGRKKEFSNGGFVINVGLEAHKLPMPNEKGWLRLVVAPRKEPDKYGNDFTVYVDDWKPQQQEATAKDRVENVPDGDGLPF